MQTTYKHIETGNLVTIEFQNETTVFVDWFENRRKNRLSNAWPVATFNLRFEEVK